MKKTTLIGLLFVIFLLNGCADTPPSTQENSESETVSSTQICDIFTDETINELIGSPFRTEPMEELDSRTGGCKFINTEDEAINARNFNIIARITEDEPTAMSEYTRATSVWRNGNMSQKKTSDIENTGTEAFWAYGSETTQLITYENEALVILTLGHLHDDEAILLEKSKTAALQTLNSLQ